MIIIIIAPLISYICTFESTTLLLVILVIRTVFTRTHFIHYNIIVTRQYIANHKINYNETPPFL
jgi:hypothetical protein